MSETPDPDVLVDAAIEDPNPVVEADLEPDPAPPVVEEVPTVEVDGPRAAFRYTPAVDDGAVSLPGYLNPIPAIVTDGVLFAVDSEYADELDVSDRFTRVPKYDAALPSVFEKLTKAEIGDALGLDDKLVNAASKDELVTAMDTHMKAHPLPPGVAADLAAVIEENDR